jgi:formamidopyrimidine-DNA glycosylase
LCVPELPEVETVRRTLTPALVGRRIARAVLHRADFCQTSGGKPCRPRELLQGMRVAALERHGKQLALIAAEGPVLVAQLGMTGQLTVTAAGAGITPSDHIHAQWLLDSGSLLRFRDPRRFGGLSALPSVDSLRERWAAMGPDGLRVTGAELADRAGRSRRSIKVVLLDQEVVAGVGNIYADEALFLARINPLRAAATLRPAEWELLADAIHRTLTAAVAAGGSTLRDYMDALGMPGRAQAHHAVYGRGGEPCLACGRGLKGVRLGGRATVYCPGCQPRRRLRLVKEA